jgi:uncharacterized protein (UPF0262 family)
LTGKAKARPEGRLIAVELDAQSIAPGASFIDEERATAIRDLIADNVFSPIGRTTDRFRLKLSLADRKLVLNISDADGNPLIRHILSLTPLRRVIKDYFLMCDAYYTAVRNASRAQIEAIDVGRRGVHNEGAEILRERLRGKIAVDPATARRLFTLVSALHWKG